MKNIFNRLFRKGYSLNGISQAIDIEYEHLEKIKNEHKINRKPLNKYISNLLHALLKENTPNMGFSFTKRYANKAVRKRVTQQHISRCKTI